MSFAEQLTRLQAFLDADELHEEALDYVAAHGYLTALSINAEDVPEREWIDALFAEEPHYASEAQRTEIEATLVALKAHAENLYALDEAQAAAVFRTTARVARAIRAAFAPEGLSVYQANGKSAGQTVFHFHIHLVPRHEGDGMSLAWPVKNPPREKLEEYASRIRAKLQ